MIEPRNEVDGLVHRLRSPADNGLTVVEALTKIRKGFMRNDDDVRAFMDAGGVEAILGLLGHTNQTVLDVSLSILGNCCTNKTCRLKVRETKGALKSLVLILKELACSSIQARICRVIGNQALDARSAECFHESGVVPMLVAAIHESNSVEARRMAARGLRILADTKGHKQSVIRLGAIKSLSPLLASESEDLVIDVLRTLVHLTGDCSPQTSSLVVESECLPRIVSLCEKKNQKVSSAALSAVFDMSSSSSLCFPLKQARAIPIVIKELEAANTGQSSGKIVAVTNTLCNFALEPACRWTVQEKNGLSMFTWILSDDSMEGLHEKVVYALLQFTHNHDSLRYLVVLGIIPLLVRIVEKWTKRCRAPHAVEEAPEESTSDLGASEEEETYVQRMERMLQNQHEVRQRTMLKSSRSYDISPAHLRPLSPSLSWDSMSLGSLSPRDRSPSPTSSCSRMSTSPPSSPMSISPPSSPLFFSSQASPASASDGETSGDEKPRDALPRPIPAIPPGVAKGERWEKEPPVMKHALSLLLGISHVERERQSHRLVTGSHVSELLPALFRYLTSMPSPSSLAIRILVNFASSPLNMRMFVVEGWVSELVGWDYPIHPPTGCPACSILAGCRSEVLAVLSCLSERDYGKGELVTSLVKGSAAEQAATCAAIPALLRSRGLLQEFLLTRYKVLERVWALLKETTDSTLFRQTVAAVCQLARNVGVSEPLALLSKEIAVVGGSGGEGEGGGGGGARSCAFRESECDVVLKADDGSEVAGRRLDLARISPVMNAMLNGFFRESKESVVGVPHASKEALVYVVHHSAGCEECEAVPELSISNAVQLLEVCDRFLLRELQVTIFLRVLRGFFDPEHLSELFRLRPNFCVFVGEEHPGVTLEQCVLQHILVGHPMSSSERARVFGELLRDEEAGGRFQERATGLLAQQIESLPYLI
ncbi:unnamed protein product [Darwinula stevensoni]|uniref:BTB domain-containing protein n=1 Tax=Darwinula stevensoni TaxID=69355 RepID=A0A7R9AEP4_9CRUS|nr:unnamed protein product [Darwinula stevensoni]CAG0902119.1 unnamed protein product [Darwinula stevensoni]